MTEFGELRFKTDRRRRFFPGPWHAKGVALLQPSQLPRQRNRPEQREGARGLPHGLSGRRASRVGELGIIERTSHAAKPPPAL